MKALRIKLKQSQAAYTREETVNNRMTYPLPPFSTVIGALHSACGYTSYHPMQLSIQGKYAAMHREIYVNHALLNNLHNDRGVLIWLSNPHSFNTGFVKVAEALKKTGNDFRKKITIQEYDTKLLEEYIYLHDLREKMQLEEGASLKAKEREWGRIEKEWKIKEADAQEEEKIQIKIKIKQGREELNRLKEVYRERREKLVDKPLDHFRTLAKGPQYQEVLYGVELVIHISAAEETLNDIMQNRHNLVNLGRSEDFIELEEMKLVELLPAAEQKDIDSFLLRPDYTIYLEAGRVDCGKYMIGKEDDGNAAQGTVYYVAKEYTIRNRKRVFERIACFYTSHVVINYEEDITGIFCDADGRYIVDLN